MDFLLQDPLCSTEDVTGVPALGVLPSRKYAARTPAEAQFAIANDTTGDLGPLFFNAPMDTVANPELLTQMLELGHYAVVDRTLINRDFEGWAAFVKEHWTNPNLWFSVGLYDAGSLFEALGEVIDGEPTDQPLKFNILVDVAHGHTVMALKIYEELAALDVVNSLMSGSICTPEAAADCLLAGCTHLRVGVGPGAMCSTRVKTGMGVPNLSAVHSIWKEMRGVHIVADGGVKEGGQVWKYLAAGATSVMIGTALAKTWESGYWLEMPPDKPEVFDPSCPPERRYRKPHRGQASAAYQRDHGNDRVSTEGVETFFDWEGLYVKDVINDLEGGLRSAISYAGVTSVVECNPEKMTLRRVTSAGRAEGKPHV